MAAPSSGPRVGVRRALTALVVALCLLTNSLSRAGADDGDPLDPPGPGTLHGTVTGSDGLAKRSVEVFAFRWDTAANTWGSHHGAHTSTTADGSFAISGLQTGRYTVAYYDDATLSPYLETWWGGHWRQEDAESLEITADNPSVEASIQLILGGGISGRVTTRAGAGIPGAQVTLHGSEVTRATSTDENGNYEVVGVAPGTYHLSLAGPWNWPPVETWWQDGESEEDAADIIIGLGTVLSDLSGTLTAPSSVSGRLIDVDGNPVANIWVSAFTRAEEGTGDWFPVAAADPKTNAKGEFTVYGLRAGEYRLAFYPVSLNTHFPNQWFGSTTFDSEAASITVPVEGRVQLGDIALLNEMSVLAYGRLQATPQVGVPISASIGETGVKGVQATYQWRRDGVLIEGATGEQYVVQPADLGARLTMRATLSAPGYPPVTVNRFADELVVPGRFTLAGGAGIDGGDRAGATLDASQAGLNWEPRPETVSYQWQRNGHDIVGQTGPTYVTTISDYGSAITAVVRVTKPGYEPAETYVSTGSTCYAASDIPPLIVSGERVVGSTLTVTTVPPATGPLNWYEWRADGYILWNEEKATLKLTKATAGKRIQPIVRRMVAACDQVVQKGPDNAPRTALAGTPRIKGTAKVHASLRVKTGTWTRGTKFHYRWYANGQVIAKATKSTVKIAKSLKGKVITVSVTGKNAGFETVTRTSVGTRKVR